MMKKYLSFAGIGLLALVSALLARPVGEYFGRTTVQSFQRGQMETSVVEAQALGARELRAQLPMQIDEVTTLQNVISAGTRLVYHNRVAVRKSDLDLDGFREVMSGQLTSNVCGQSDMREILRLGGTYSYVYVDLDGIVVDEFLIESADC